MNPLEFGRYQLSTHLLGTFRLDGGAMFGSVPKNLWAKLLEVDDENCIQLATRSLLIKGEGRVFLVDVGNGEKWSDKFRQIFAFKNTPPTALSFDPKSVTDIILTHLHFDHAGGISRFRPGTTEPELCYPWAKVHLQSANLENAKHPSVRERASYLKENVDVLSAAKLHLISGAAEIAPDLWVHRIDGHTVGQQYVEVRAAGRSVVFPTDLIPTSRHLPVSFNMGYDNCAGTVLKEKEALLSQVEAKDSIVVFEHDPDTIAATITRDGRGHYAIKDKLKF